MKDLDFGVIDDSHAAAKMALLGVIGAAWSAGSETISHAAITISTEFLIPGKESKVVDITGEGIYTTGYFNTNEKSFAKAVERAISDFALKLTSQIEKVLNK